MLCSVYGVAMVILISIKATKLISSSPALLDHCYVYHLIMSQYEKSVCQDNENRLFHVIPSTNAPMRNYCLYRNVQFREGK